MANIRLYALFTNNSVPVTGLTLAQIQFTIIRIVRSTNVPTEIVTGAAATFEAGRGYYGYVRAGENFVLNDYVAFAQYTGASTVDQIYIYPFTEVDEPVSSRSTLGSGANSWTYTLTRSDTGAPIADADVWVSSDAAGNTILGSGRTNSAGGITFDLDSGTVFVWRQKSGFNFVNPDTETV